MGFLSEILIFLFSSTYVILLDDFAFSPRSLQKALAVIVITLLIIIYKYSRNSWKELSTGFGRLFFIFWSTISVQLLVISTGGLQSPFLILIYLFMIGLSFVFSFFLSLLFLFSCLIILFANTSLINNPGQVILQIISLIVIIPIAYIISKQYHLKDALMNALNIKIKTTEAILKNLPELIIVTDQNFNILSTNDAAARTLQRSRSELLNKPLFDILLLKDKDNKLVTSKTFFPDGNLASPVQIDDVFTLIQSPVSQKNVNIQVQALENPSENLTQIDFIISFGTDKDTSIILDKARTKYDALAENIKQKLTVRNLNDIKTDMLLLQKIESDTYTLHELQNILKEKTTSRIDIAKLGRTIVILNKDFADQLHVNTNFELPDFGEKDIAPLTVQNYHATPEQLTGAFFTAVCDAKKLELITKKLFDISILLASNQKNSHVTLSIKRYQNTALIIKISGNCPNLTDEELRNLFIPYYGKLSAMTNLRLGSGLEGYLVKTIANSLNVHIKIDQIGQPKSNITFTFMINKKNSLLT